MILSGGGVIISLAFRTSRFVHSVFPDLVGPDTTQVNGNFSRKSIKYDNNSYDSE